MHPDYTDIWGDTMKLCEGNLAVQRFALNVIEEVAHIAHAE